MRRGCLFTFSIVLGFLIVMLLSHSHWLPRIYTYLDVSQSPQLADVIVVLSGSNILERPQVAAELYTQGYAPKIILSGDAPTIHYFVDVIERTGIPDDDFFTITGATSTYEEALQVLDVVQTINATSIIIVTNPFHTRRSLATYRHVFESRDVILTIVGASNGVEPLSWWHSQLRSIIAMEYVKMAGYWFRYGIWSG
jgi:uncharacterized SAM-binding protein YcdF (DUF218 family)